MTRAQAITGESGGTYQAMAETCSVFGYELKEGLCAAAALEPEQTG